MAQHTLVFIDTSRLHSKLTTVGRNPLDDWSAGRRELYLTTHTVLTRDKHPCPRRDSNTQSQLASGLQPTP